MQHYCNITNSDTHRPSVDETMALGDGVGVLNSWLVGMDQEMVGVDVNSRIGQEASN